MGLILSSSLDINGNITASGEGRFETLGINWDGSLSTGSASNQVALRVDGNTRIDRGYFLVINSSSLNEYLYYKNENKSLYIATTSSNTPIDPQLSLVQDGTVKAGFGWDDETDQQSTFISNFTLFTASLSPSSSLGGIGLSTSGSDGSIYRLKISQLGNVGIGTDTPGEKLVVSGSISASANIIGNDISGSKLFVGSGQILTAKVSGFSGTKFIPVLTVNEIETKLGDHAEGSDALGLCAKFVNITTSGSINSAFHNRTTFNSTGNAGSVTINNAAGHITASGNISSSGILTDQITAGIELSITGNTSASGFIQSDKGLFVGSEGNQGSIHISSSDSLNDSRNSQIKFYRGLEFRSSATNTDNILRLERTGQVGIGSSPQDSSLLYVSGSITANNDITASGNISGSATSNLIVGGDINAGGRGTFTGRITALSDIVTPKILNNTSANAGTVLIDDGLTISGNTTASGNISASGDTHIFGGKVSIGVDQTNTGTLSSIAGGKNNNISGKCNFIGGGISNSMAGSLTGSFIGGGCSNSILGNLVNTNSSFGKFNSIVGGCSNSISGSNTLSVYTGGSPTNIVSSIDFAFIGGGANNLITNTGSFSSIVGGLNNKVSQSLAFIGGGCNNTISNYYNNKKFAVIVGGSSNSMYGSVPPDGAYGAFIGGGSNNVAHPLLGTVAGGQINTSLCYGFVGGGQRNKAGGCTSTAVGGECNTAGGYFSFIGGGLTNKANGGCSSTVGGQGNITSAAHSFVGGGKFNSGSGTCSGVLGGINNKVTHAKSFIVGSDITSTVACTTFVNNLYVTGSTTANSLLTLARLSTTPAAGTLQTGSVFHSGSDGAGCLYFSPNGSTICKIQFVS